MNSKLHKLNKLRKKAPSPPPELTNGYRIYAWVWLVLSLNWAAWVLQASLTSKVSEDGFGLAFALPGVLVAGLAIWLLRTKPENRRTAIVAIGGTTTLFFIANIVVAFVCLLAMALALRTRKV